MKKIARYPYSHDGVNYQWVYVNDHYDIHLSGLVKHKGELCRFVTDDQTYWNDETDDMDGETYVDIFSLTLLEKIKAKWRQKRFEWCVGYHWSYPYRAEGHHFHIRNPRWLYHFLFNFHYYGLKLHKYRNWR